MPAKNKLVILKKEDINHKLNRLACQILEKHADAKTIQFVGLNKRGYSIALLLQDLIGKLDKTIKINLYQGKTEQEIAIDDFKKLEGNIPIIVVDDVLNTGGSMYKLLTYLGQINPSQIQICVLADRKHKKFPFYADFVGLSFATTLQEHIFYDAEKPELFLQ